MSGAKQGVLHKPGTIAIGKRAGLHGIRQKYILVYKFLGIFNIYMQNTTITYYVLHKIH